MSAYVTRAEIEASGLPPKWLVEALDDNGDKAEDTGLLDAIIARASADVDGILGQRFAVPFATPPPVAARAARILVMATLYRRRLVPEDKNPYAKAEVDAVAKLTRIAVGDEPLMPGGAAGEADIACEPSPTHDAAGRISL